MAKRTISFKPTPECEVQIADLMGRWKCDRTTAMIRAIAKAHAGGNSEMATASPPRLSPGGLTRGATVKLSSRHVDQDKLAAFQRKAGMGGVKQRG